MVEARVEGRGRGVEVASGGLKDVGGSSGSHGTRSKLRVEEGAANEVGAVSGWARAGESASGRRESGRGVGKVEERFGEVVERVRDAGGRGFENVDVVAAVEQDRWAKVKGT